MQFSPLETYMQEAEDLLAEIEQSALLVASGRHTDDTVHQLFRAFHTIKGSGAMCGLDAVAGFTHHVETLLDKVREGAVPASPPASVTHGFDFAILATDISTRVLDFARNGIYQHSQVQPVAPELRRKYLARSRNKDETLVRVIPELRKKVSFHPLNFMDHDYGVREVFDVIFFRNVMIYFDRPTQEAVINKLCRNLAPGGYLFAGHSESLAGLDIPVNPVKASIYRKPDR